MKAFIVVGLMLLVLTSAQTRAAALDLVWTAEKLLIAGQRATLPHQPKWPAQQADLVAYSMTGVVPDGVNCQLEVKLREKLLLSLPCTKRYVLERPLRITPAMRVELSLYNANFSSRGEEVVLRNRLSLDVVE